MTAPDPMPALGALAAHDVEPAAARRIRALALEELARRPSWRERLATLYVGVLEPALLAAVCVAYLGWAFQASAGVLLHSGADGRTAAAPAQAAADPPG